MPEQNVVRKNLGQYESQGFIGPIRAFGEAEMQGVAHALLCELKQKKGILTRRNRHLDWDVAHRLATARAVVDSAAQILGPELVLWRTHFFTIRQGKGLTWHQDEYRTLLSDPLHQISAHLGITEARENNCIMVLPGSHKMTLEELAEQGFNLIPGSEKGVYGAPNFWRDPATSLDIIKMTLRPGEFFVFHPRLVHASHDLTTPPNASPNTPLPPKTLFSPRVGFVLRITVPENKVFPAAFAETISRGDHCVRMVAK